MANLETSEILAKLKSGRSSFSTDVGAYSVHAGIYAVFFEGVTFPSLCPDVKRGDLIYIGKTESSQISRDLNTHFADGRTGSSTLRRTLGALLLGDLRLRPQPRSATETSDRKFKNYRFDAEGERKLTQWMRRNLGLAFFEMPNAVKAEIKQVESSLITLACPILNLAENAANLQGDAVRAARKACVNLARSAGGGTSTAVKTARNPKKISQAKTRASSAMFLHDAIATVLRDFPSRTATAKEIADDIEQRGLYRQKAGGPAPAKQVLLRARKRPKLFEILPSQRVKLI